MKKIRIKDSLNHGHSLMNNIVMDTASHIAEASMVIKIDDLLKERGLTQKDLAQMTGMRVGTISEIINGKGISINKVQIFAIMVALRVTNLSDILEIQFPTDLATTYNIEREEWLSDREMPISVKEMYRENVLKATGLNK